MTEKELIAEMSKRIKNLLKENDTVDVQYG
jgi:hypothetical protein